jgi:hypothetical protein
MRCGKHIIPENRVERFLILVAAERLPRASVPPWLWIDPGAEITEYDRAP